MKKLFLLSLIIFLSFNALIAQSLPGSGSWLITKVFVDNQEEEVLNQIDFLENGNINLMGMDFGKWKYDGKRNEFEIKSPQFKELDGTSKVIKINEEELILELNTNKIFFVKLDSDKISEENEESGFIGVWEIETDNPEGTKIVSFEAPDIFSIVERDPGMETRTSGQWIFNKTNMTLLMIGIQEEMNGYNNIIGLTEDNFELKNKAKLFKAKRKELKSNEINRLNFSEEDFFTEDGDYKYESDVEKLPWQDSYLMISSLENVASLVYSFSTLIEGTETFENKILTSNVNANLDEMSLSIDYIFYGYDNYNLPEDTELPPNSEYTNLLYPLNENSFRISAYEDCTTPAGTFSCTVIEAVGNHESKMKLWMINDKPGIYAKIIDDEPGNFGHYIIYELQEIK